METNQNTTDEMEIDLGEIFRELWSKALIIIFSALAVALLAILISKTFLTPEYVSTTKLYVLAKNDSDTLTSGDLQAGALLTTDYEEIIQSRQVTETVIARLNLKDNSGEMLRHEELLEKISVSTPSDSRVINISVTDDDPYEACDIANAVRDAASDHIQNVMDTQTVSVVENANIPLSPDSPSTMKNGVIGGLIGAVAAIVIILIIYLTNDTIRTGEDIEKYLGLSTLGTIPLATGEKKSAKVRNRKQMKKQEGKRL